MPKYHKVFPKLLCETGKQVTKIEAIIYVFAVELSFEKSVGGRSF